MFQRWRQIGKLRNYFINKPRTHYYKTWEIFCLRDRNRQWVVSDRRTWERKLTDVYGAEFQPPTPRFQVTHYFGSFIVEGPNYFSQRSGWSILMPIYFRRSDDLREEQSELSTSITRKPVSNTLGYLFIFQVPYKEYWLREKIFLCFAVIFVFFLFHTYCWEVVHVMLSLN